MIPERSLESICDLLTDGTHYTPPDVGSGVPFLTVKDVSDKGLDLVGCSKISVDEFLAARRQNSAPKKGDILFSKDGTVGKVHLVREDIDFAVLSSLAIIRPKQDIVDAGFLSHFLRTPKAIEAAGQRKTGSAIRRIVLRDLGNLPIPVLPISKQRRIAAILDQADSLRQKRQWALDRLEELEAAAFQELHYRSSNSLKTMSLAGIAHSEQHSFGNGPFGSDLLTSELTETGVPVIYIRDIRGAEYSRVSKVFVTEEKAKELAFCSVQAGDVLIAKVGDPPGTSAVYPSGEPDAIITQDVIRLRVDKQKAFPEYVAAFLNSSIGQSRIKSITVQATRARFALRELKQLLIEIPVLSQQEKFVERVREIGTIKKNQRTHLVQLDALFASLQHRAFRGEL